MKKKQIIIITSIVIVVLITIFGLYHLISNNNSVSNNNIFPTPTEAINRSAIFNENGYHTYVVEGVVDNIQSTDPLMIDIVVRTEKIFPEYSEPLIKTITLANDAQVIIRNLATNEESTISAYTTINKNDDLVAWLLEPNIKLLEFESFAATKIIINK